MQRWDGLTSQAAELLTWARMFSAARLHGAEDELGLVFIHTASCNPGAQSTDPSPPSVTAIGLKRC